MALLMLQFVIGVIILIISTQLLIHLAKKLSKVFKISPLIVGITVVALGTSLPELSVSMTAVFKNDVGLALGNIIGSNIINILLVLPLSILIGSPRIGKTKTQRNIMLLFLITLLFIFQKLILFPAIFAGLLLLILTLVVTVQEYQWGILGRDHEDLAFFRYFHPEKMKISEIVIFPFLVIGIFLGGFLVVNSTEQISIISGYSTTILGLSLTAISTSLPELMTTFISIGEKQEKLVIGNIIGSNIYNLLLVGGLVTLFAGRTKIIFNEVAWLFLSTLCFVYIIKRYRNERAPKSIGLALLVLLFFYLFSLSIK